MNLQNTSTSTGKWGMGAVIFGVLAVFGISIRKGDEPKANPPASPPIPVATAQPSADDPTARAYLIKQVFRFPRTNANERNVYKKHAEQLDASMLARARINVLVVTMPDPFDTPFAFRHDQIVECLTMAAADARYAVAGHWSPWEMHKALHSRPGAPPVLAPLYERQPGVLLFRRRGFDPDEAEEYLAILLVGETANTLHREAFIASLALAKEFRDHRYPNEPIRLVAPFNTGIQDILLMELHEFHRQSQINVHVISGGATGLRRKDKRLEWLTLETTVVPSWLQQNAAIRFLHERVVDSSKSIWNIGDIDRSVGLIVDSNSGFGVSRLARLDPHQSPEKLADAPPEPTTPKMHYFRTSMHLARLQAQYLQRRREEEKRLGQAVGPAPPPTARPAQRPNVDVPQSLDEIATPPLVDRSIDDLALLLLREDIRIVGIVVTDPLDRVFMVERVKKFNPNAEIFVVGMDLIYTLPENRHVMRGVVIASTYPLYAGNQLWTQGHGLWEPPQGPLHQAFQSQPAMGYFNAATIHLANVVERSSSFWRPWAVGPDHTRYLQRHLAEYSTPTFATNANDAVGRKPPVWIMTVGENGRMVPHGFYDVDPKTKDGESTPVDQRYPPMFTAPNFFPLRPTIPFPMIRQFRHIAAGVLIVAWFLLWWMTSRRGIWNANAAAANRGRHVFTLRGLTPMTPREQEVGVFQQFVIGAIIIALTPFISVVLLMLTLSTYPSSSHSPGKWTRVCLCFMVSPLILTQLLAVFLSARLLVRFVRAWGGGRSSLEWYARLAIHLATIAGYAGFVLWFGIIRCVANPPASLVMDIERSVGVLTGNSPILPLLFLTLGFVFYGYYGLKRNYIGTHFRFDPPYPNANPRGANDAVGKVLSEIRSESIELGAMLKGLFGHVRHRKGLLLLIGVATLIACGSFIVRCRSLFEHKSWNYAFAIGFLILSMIVVITIVRFLDGWKHLRRIMERMAFVPMVRAYDRLPRKAADVFSGYFASGKPRESHTIFPRHLLAQIPAELWFEWNLKAPACTRDLPAGRPADRGDREFPSEAFEDLNVAARRLCEKLRQHWPRSSVIDAFGEDGAAAVPTGEKNNLDASSFAAHATRAEEFVAMLSIVFLSQFFSQLRYLAFAMITASLLLMLAITSYPFQPEMLLMYVMAGILAAVCGAIVWVLIGINRDEIYSRITRSTPNRFELNWQFVQTVLTLVGPVVLIAAAQFSGRLRDLFTPLLEQLR